MTLDEATKIALIIGTADGGCRVCVGNLADKLNEAFPEFVWTPGESTHDEDTFEHSVAVAVAACG